MHDPALRLEALRRRLARMEGRAPSDASRFDLGHPQVDAGLGGLNRRALHEVQAGTGADLASADGFALGLAVRAAGTGVIAWIVQTMTTAEVGLPYGAGLADWGLDAGRVLFVQTRDATRLLAAAEDALRSGALGAVVMSVWAEPKALNLTATRRLALAARERGTAAILVRSRVAAQAGPAETRWTIKAAPSRALEDGAPGRPALTVRLDKNRTGAKPGQWVMEWRNDERRFADLASVSGDLVPLVGQQPAAA
ncbi:MAG: hypothetical protein J0L52_10330 [Caulobacterales bacterium]|nr:hypothetical protein [Caulobacterales bacterium]